MFLHANIHQCICLNININLFHQIFRTIFHETIAYWLFAPILVMCSSVDSMHNDTIVLFATEYINQCSINNICMHNWSICCIIWFIWNIYDSSPNMQWMCILHASNSHIYLIQTLQTKYSGQYSASCWSLESWTSFISRRLQGFVTVEYSYNCSM